MESQGFNINERPRNKLNGSIESMCCYCGNACNRGCSWSDDFTPVNGWEAVENKNGYFVVDCPEYISDKHMHDNPQELDTEGCINLIEAMINTMREDYLYMSRSRQAIERFIRRPHMRQIFFFADPEEIIMKLRMEAEEKRMEEERRKREAYDS